MFFSSNLHICIYVCMYILFYFLWLKYSMSNKNKVGNNALNNSFKITPSYTFTNAC